MAYTANIKIKQQQERTFVIATYGIYIVAIGWCLKFGDKLASLAMWQIYFVLLRFDSVFYAFQTRTHVYVFIYNHLQAIVFCFVFIFNLFFTSPQLVIDWIIVYIKSVKYICVVFWLIMVFYSVDVLIYLLLSFWVFYEYCNYSAS